jgi:hypothetical protein
LNQAGINVHGSARTRMPNLFHGRHAGFAVAISSGQDNGDDSLLQTLRRRLEEVFGGGPGAMHFIRLRERKSAIGIDQLLVSRGSPPILS